MRGRTRTIALAAGTALLLAVAVVGAVLLVTTDPPAIVAGGRAPAPEAPPAAARPTPEVHSPAEHTPRDPADGSARDFRGDHVLDGVAIDANGDEPVPGAVVELHPGSGPLRRPLARVTTDENGRFAFTGLAPGEFTLRIRAPNRDVRVHRHQRSRSPTARRTERRLELGRDPRTTFYVEAPDGSRVADAELWQVSLGKEVLQRLEVDAEQGLAWVPPEGAVLWVIAPGYADTRVSGWRAGKDLVVRPAPGHVVAGVVRDEAGASVMAASVAIPNATGPGRDKLVTDADGVFRFVGLREGTVPLQVRADGFVPLHLPTATGRTDLELVLVRPRGTRTVTGTVLRPDGSPAAGARVHGSTHADAEGAFELPHVPAGPRRIGAQNDRVSLGPEGPHVHREQGYVDLDSSSDERIVIRLTAAPVSFLAVRVVNGRGKPAARMRVRPVDGAPQLTDADGRAVLHFAAFPGTARQVVVGGAEQEPFDVVTQGDLDGPETELVLTDDAPLVIELEGIDVSDATRVRIALARDGWPIDASRTEASEFAFSPPVGERLLVQAYHGDALTMRILPPIEPGGRRAVIDMTAGAHLRLRITGADGAPERRATALVTLPHRDVCRRTELARARFVEPGVLEAENLTAGRVEVFVYVDRRLAHRAEVRLAEGVKKELGIQLAAPTAVSGRVTDEDANPLGGCRVGLALDGGLPGSEAPLYPLATTAADGSWSASVPRLAAARLAVVREGYATRFVELGAGLARAASAIRLEPAGTIRFPPDALLDYVAHARDPGTGFTWRPRLGLEVGPNHRVRHLVQDLPLGATELAIVLRSGRLESLRVEVESGTMTDVTLPTPR